MSQETKNTTEQDLPVEETVQQPPETGEPVRQPEPAQEPAKEPAKEEKQPSELDSVKQQATFVWRRNMTISASAARRKKTSSTP